MTDKLDWSYAELLEAHREFHELDVEYWRQHELFTCQWWALFIVLFIPWIILLSTVANFPYQRDHSCSTRGLCW